MIKHYFESKKTVSVLFLVFFSVVILYGILFEIGVVNRLPGNRNVIRYDAWWFDQIRFYGYLYTPGQMSNVAFFPFFPYLWKWTHLDGIEISFFNLLVFAFSFILLIGKQKYSVPFLMVMGSLPCFIFFFLPYSEACFFLFGTLLIIGYRRGNRLLQAIGLFGCCLTRSIGIFFIPAVIITELLAYRRSEMNRKELLTNVIINVSVCIASILIVVVIQGLQTGKWFYYIEVQKYWKRQWIMPSLPFTTVSPNKVLGIDGIALIIGCVAIFFCFKWGYSYFSSFFRPSNLKINRTICKSIYFSALFLSAVVITDTCFTYDIEGRTNIQCLNRHLMCTSFAVCFFNWFCHFKLQKQDVYAIVVILLSGIFFTGIFSYTHHLFYYLLFFISFFMYKLSSKYEPVLYLLFCCNVFFLAIFYQDFLNGFWIG